MNNSPLISVIVPVYNREEYIFQCLDSICQQTLCNIEIICVNDGSTDNSEAIIQKFCKKDPRVHLVNQANSGPSTARKNGIRHASGKYIGFVDSDDYIDKDFFLNLYTTALQKDADIVVTSAFFAFDGKKLHKKKSFIDVSTTSLSTESRGRLFLYTASLCNKIYKKSLIEKVLKYYFSNETFAEDNPFTIFLTIFAKNIFIINSSQYFYRQHSLSICHTKASIENCVNSYTLYNKIINTVKCIHIPQSDQKIYIHFIKKRRNWDCSQMAENLSFKDWGVFLLRTGNILFQINLCLRKFKKRLSNAYRRRSS